MWTIDNFAPNLDILLFGPPGTIDSLRNLKIPPFTRENLAVILRYVGAPGKLFPKNGWNLQISIENLRFFVNLSQFSINFREILRFFKMF